MDWNVLPGSLVCVSLFGDFEVCVSSAKSLPIRKDSATPYLDGPSIALKRFPSNPVTHPGGEPFGKSGDTPTLLKILHLN